MLLSPRPWSTTLLVTLLCCACGEPEPSPVDTPPKHVLLISLDTLRADHCGFHGYEKPTTPFLDTLAERGVVFENHFANANCTLPSHASMLTGLFTPTHGVLPGTRPDEAMHVLPAGAVTLAQRFSEHGYQTTAITAHPIWLNEEYGFARGFDHFLTNWRKASVTVNDYLFIIEKTAPEKSFSFLHFFDVHSDFAERGPCFPYQSNEELIAAFAGPVPEGFTGCTTDRPGRCASSYLQDISRRIEPLPDEHREFLIGLYDAGIRQLDDALEVLFAGLEQRGILDETLVVITADHGEAFFEHGLMLHGSHHDEVSRVPLIVLPPPRMKAAHRRIQAMTQSTDLAPTILELCGLPSLGQTQSLAAAVMLGAEPDPALILFHGQTLLGRDERSEFKYINVGDFLDGVPRFFDRSADPEERRNLYLDGAFQEENAGRLSGIARRLDVLVTECESINLVLRAGETGGAGVLEEERQRMLEKLGYFGGEGD